MQERRSAGVSAVYLMAGGAAAKPGGAVGPSGAGKGIARCDASGCRAVRWLIGFVGATNVRSGSLTFRRVVQIFLPDRRGGIAAYAGVVLLCKMRVKWLSKSL